MLCPLPARVCFPLCRYFVLMPAGGEGGVSLSAAGEQFVIDPYSEGMLLSVAEVGAERAGL
jgi:hypothetical protein